MNTQPVEKSEYQIQAETILANIGANIEITFFDHGKHFADDKETRDIYWVKLTKGTRSYGFKFGQSKNDSVYKIKDPFVFHFPTDVYILGSKLGSQYKISDCYRFASSKAAQFRIDKGLVPTAYDVLACLTKYDPGSLENFCGEFGYDQDSRMAEATYNAVKHEFEQLQMLFTDSELDALREIV